MKKIASFCSAAVLIASSFLLNNTVQAQQILDRVVVVVDDGVVLQSQIDQLIQQVKNGQNFNASNAPSDEVLETQAIERLVLQEIQLQMADRMGIEIDDNQLEQAINEIANNQDLTTAELRENMISSGMSWAAYRENIRNELVIQQVQRAAVQQRVSITPQEINNLVKLIDSNQEVQTEYRLGQILISADSNSSQAELEKAKERANTVLSLLDKGNDFSDLAVRSSSGSAALDGGDMGWMTVNSMPTLFAEAVDGKSVGDVVGPIRSGIGFHILKVQDKRGEQTVEVQEVKARHILIKPSVILSDNKAKEMLAQYRQQIASGEKTFEELAREHSSDPGSASRGGDLGWARPDKYAPEFKQKVENIEQGTISEPFSTQFGWHIVEVTDRRTLDATEENKQERAYQMLFSRKFREELDNWQQEIRDQAFIRRVAE
ncbi:peptidylprolyl isomerase SurA [Idiomarina sp. PL1-037]|uniref:peptidylprolyl isomerase SurA n=1 Tax=unclassified Idiomarina TaxID=2614829 RepID=UPI00294B7097|nr:MULTISPECIES: peptidylprolyl isomerase SurA [unclassified Idiomarina]MDV6327544.1 peptidylprolyl isomerase SurA [Idiomarina sp. Sol25]WQC52646.1 peptidylprolyl isomerase SurA [Idiomarina sp. PL1-037]